MSKKEYMQDFFFFCNLLIFFNNALQYLGYITYSHYMQDMSKMTWFIPWAIGNQNMFLQSKGTVVPQQHGMEQGIC